MITYYQILEIPADATFAELKKAYFRKAKQLHPDTDPNNPTLEEKFKQLVNAFNTLSDPVQRRLYNQKINSKTQPPSTPSLKSPHIHEFDAENSILDSHSDDLLEELVSGNPIYRGTHLWSLFQNLQSTSVFVTFREAKNLCSLGDFHAAYPLLLQCVNHSPNNILYHYFVARTAIKLGRLTQADYHLHNAVDIGLSRTPPLKMSRLKRELQAFQQYRRPWYTRWFYHLIKPSNNDFIPSDEAMRIELERAMAKNLTFQSTDKPSLPKQLSE